MIQLVRFHVVLTAAFCLFVSPFSVGAQVVDDFTEAPVTLTRLDDPVSLLQTGLNSEHVVGGSRDIILGDSGSAGQTVDVSNGSLSFVAGGGFSYLTLIYGSFDTPLSLDIAAAGQDRIVFENFSGSATGIFRLWSPAGSSTASLNLLSSTRPYLLFSDFSGTVDFSDIGSFQFDSFRVLGSFSFDSIAVTADPDFLPGDVNGDERIDFFDIAPFIALLSNNAFQDQADIDRDGSVNFADIQPFIQLLNN